MAQQRNVSLSDVNDNEFDAVIVHGDELDNMLDDHWDRILAKKEIVFARLVSCVN